MDRSTMTDSITCVGVAAVASVPHEYAVLPLSAPAIIRNNTISIQAQNKIQPIVDDERRRNFQSLVRRYMNQLLYGCQRDVCDTPTCYTCRKGLSRNKSASRRLTLLSARIIACSLATDDDPLKALCPGKPVVPTLATETSSKDSGFADELDEDEEKENRPDGGEIQGRTRRTQSRPKEVSVVTDKGLKDPRSFTQQLFSTVAMKMVEWISLPPPNRTLSFSSQGSAVGENKSLEGGYAALPSPQEPPKFKFPSNPMEVMDTGRLNRDSEPVSQIKHQEILQQQTRKRGPSLKDVTPTPHSNAAKAKLSTPVSAFTMPPPQLGNYYHVHQQGRKSTNSTMLQITPTRGGKNTQPFCEPVETVAPPQSLKRLDEDICKALVAMCASEKAANSKRRDAKQFAKQSIFYVFSTPEAALVSFGGIGKGGSLGFDPNSVSRSLNTLHGGGWGERTRRSIWAGLANVFTKPGKGMSDREAAGMIILSLHVLASGVVKDDEVFRIVTEMRAAGRMSSGKDIAPDIGFDDELAERLMKRVLRAMSFRKSRPGDNTVSYVKQYLCNFEELLRKEKRNQIAEELGTDMLQRMDDIESDIGLARYTLEWTRTVFMRNWDRHRIIKRDSLVASCIEMFEFLYTDRKSYGLSSTVFEAKTVSDIINPYSWPAEWFRTTSSPNGIHLLDHQYLLSVPHKVTFFRAINLDTMKMAYETSIANIRMAAQMTELTKVGNPTLAGKIDIALGIYLVLTIRRGNLLEDALNQLIYREHRELMRPLKIKFAGGEEGVDQGGVQQEFFSLLVKEILRPEYGVFLTDERTRLSWFCESTLEGAQKFELVGIVVGLAVYNGITLPVNFPKTLYIKLLGGTPTLDDIDDYWPELTRGLKGLLSWDDGDVGDVFVRTYEYSYPVFGQVRSVNMLDAKINGPEFLPQLVPAIKTKKTVKEFSRATEDWLPAVDRPTDQDPWLGSLNHILGELNNENEDNEGRLQRFATGTTRYTVSYINLNSGELTSERGENLNTAGEEAELGGRIATNDPEQETRAESSCGTSSETESSPFGHDRDDSSEKSWQTLGDEDDSSLPAAQVKLPSDDGEDWDDRSTTYSPTGSIYERALEGSSTSPLEFEDQDTTVEEHPVSPEEEVDAPSDDSANTATQEQNPEPIEEAPLVTNANRHQYVNDYLSWLTDRSIRRQYLAFQRGFSSVVSARSISLFDAPSFQALIEGQSGINIGELEAVCKYEDGYHSTHRVICDFWAVVRGFDDDQKRLLLEFVTGSPRVPIGGLGNIMFYIVRNGEDSERLPSSLTCFGRLLLPEYSDRKKLEMKLGLSLENSKGFGNP